MSLIGLSLIQYYNTYLKNDYVQIGNIQVAKAPVTQLEWFIIMKNNPSYFKNNGLNFQGFKINPLNPVDSISYKDIQIFLDRINEIDNKYSYRLPTDEEWINFCGEIPENILDYAWCSENYNGKNHPIKQKLPNKYGLYDILGNVWEWNSTRDGSSVALRGGSFGDSLELCRSAVRFGYDPSGDEWLFGGFRLARMDRHE